MNVVAKPNEAGETKQSRTARLLAQDEQLRAAAPSEAVVKAKTQPGLRIAEVVKIVMEGYAGRPALGIRARELVTDPATGRNTLRLLPRFDMVTYKELWHRARATAADWHEDGLKPGDFVCVLGFASPDYATLLLSNIHLGAVIVPLQASAPASQHAAIMAETNPRILASGIDYLEIAVEAALTGTAPSRLVVFDYDGRDDAQREKFEAAQASLAAAKSPLRLEALGAAITRGATLPPAPLYVAPPDEDPLAWLFYTSGTTGTPKGAIFTQSLVIGSWLSDTKIPTVTLSFMPMSHLVGNGYMILALANGGTSYCAPKSDLSTLFEDLPLARPTMASIVPRVCEMFFHHFLREVDKRVAQGRDVADVENEVKREMRETLLGGRLISVGCGSASLAPEIHEFMNSMLNMHMAIGYSSTEIAGGTVLVDWKVQRPPVLAYKLADVPELGYFSTDKPYPRGELLVKTDRFMGGYYKRPDLTAEKLDAEGFYRTGDVMAELGPDHLVFVDRCNNVIKLSQGEFVAIARLEALYTRSPVIKQIYIYGSSERSYLLAVVVPDEAAAHVSGEELKQHIRRSLQEIAADCGLNSYEIPRDFLIESEPFSPENGLLTGIGKFSRPNFKARYGARLEQLYQQISQEQIDELRALRLGGADRPVRETVLRAVQAILGLAAADVRAEAQFAELGGDSLSALEFSTLLGEIFSVEVPVGVIINPAGNLQLIADYIENARHAGTGRPGFSTIHRADSTEVHASELKLERFIDPALLAKARSLPRAERMNTVLMTGATGFLGRFQALAWLERLAAGGGKLVLLARGATPAQARRRIDESLASDPALLAHFSALTKEHLEVLPGDLGLPQLGLSGADWERLSQEVDVIVHPGAHVNHVLPYAQLFAANVLGTAELIRLALSTKVKHFHYVSTLGVSALSPSLVDEDSDIRTTVPSCTIDESYANGYGISKWASEVLLREAFDLCAMPVSVFRPGMILAHSRYAGQLNVPDMFTRLLYSLAVTGVAPASFYAQNLSAGRPRARYDGISVDYLAEFITNTGMGNDQGFNSYNLAKGGESAVSLDDFVDWMIEYGCAIERVEEYDSWLSRFETAMRLLPEEQRQHSLLTLIGPYRKPQHAGTKSALKSARFTAAAGGEIPSVSPALIRKYVSDLRGLALLP